MSISEQSIGFIGVGSLATAMVEGLCADDAPPIQLSPRGATNAAALAERFETVRVHETNQTVVDASDVVVISVLPQQLADVLDEIDVPTDRVVISAITSGWPVARIAERLGGGADVVRSIPLPSVRERAGTTPMFPDHPVARALFELLGGVLVPAAEDDLDAITVATATVATHLEYLSTIAGWLGERGFEPAAAEHFVRAMFDGLGPELRARDLTLQHIRQSHETPGGLNLQIRTEWLDQANRTALTDTFDRVLDRIRRPSSF